MSEEIKPSMLPRALAASKDQPESQRTTEPPAGMLGPFTARTDEAELTESEGGDPE